MSTKSEVKAGLQAKYMTQEEEGVNPFLRMNIEREDLVNVSLRTG